MILESSVHHIGYLVTDLDRSASAFRALGFQEMGEAVYDEDRRADIRFLRDSGGVVELIAPHRDSPVYPLLKKYKDSVYHICLQVGDLEEAVERLQAEGFLSIQGIQRAVAISGSARVAFLMHAGLGIVELVQSAEGAS